MPTGPSTSIQELAKALQALQHAPTTPSTPVYVSLLKSCIIHKQKGLLLAKQLQHHIAQHHVPLTGLLAHHLILTFARCGSLNDALLVSAQLPYLTVFSGTALMSAFTDSNRPVEALRFYQSMQEQGVQPSMYTFVSLFKACGNIPDLHHGMRFHGDALAYGLQLDAFLGNTLVSMYGKCGAIKEAEHVFCELNSPDIVSWNAMLSAYVEQGEGGKALQLYAQMPKENISPDRPTYVSILQACSAVAEEEDASLLDGELIKAASLEMGRLLHVDIDENGFTSNVFVNSTLIRMYGKCGALIEAEWVFSALLHHDMVACSAMLSVYVELGHGEKALRLYRQMHEEGISSDGLANVLALQAYDSLMKTGEGAIQNRHSAKVMSIGFVHALHAVACRGSFKNSTFLYNTLVIVYGKCGAIAEACHAFNSSPKPDVACWNALLSAHVEHGLIITALQLYVRMQGQGITPDVRTYVTMLQACAIHEETEERHLISGGSRESIFLTIGKALQVDVCKQSLTSDPYVTNATLNMFMKCGAIVKAEDLFIGLYHRNIVSWSVMLSGYIEQREGVKALRLYRQMQEEAAGSSDELTFILALRACMSLVETDAKAPCLEIGQALHLDICRKDSSWSDSVGSTLLGMYSNCGNIAEAECMWVAMSEHAGVSSWNAILCAYVQQGQPGKALLGYRQMQEECRSPNQATFVIAIQACAILAKEVEAYSVEGPAIKAMPLAIGRALHEDANRKGFSQNVFVSSILISMYSRCGAIKEAEDVFNGLPQKTIVSWNAILSAFIEDGQDERVFWLYGQILNQGIAMDEVTLTNVLQACAMAGSLDRCKAVHFVMVCYGLEQIPSMACSLLHAYGSCATMIDGQDCLEMLVKLDMVSWNACIAGHVSKGNTAASLRLFEELKFVNMEPSKLAFLGVLAACAHAGLLGQGLEYFRSIREDYELHLDKKHYGSLVDLLGRAGDFRGLEDLLTRMPVQSNFPMWSSLLGACRVHANVELANEVFHHAILSDPQEATAYVMMSNIYANGGWQQG